ncbi:MAG: phosphatase PAP2 family protein [Pseudomonadota bacterium]
MKLTPWGVIPEERSIHANSSEMSDWPAGQDWGKFVQARTNEFAEHLWPIWDPNTARWVGGAAANMEEATKAELEICKREFHDKNILEDFPDTPLVARANLAPKNHLWHYQVEDFIGYDAGFADDTTANTPIANIVFYDPNQTSEEAWKAFGKSSGRKASGLFALKLTFQRPRPYTAAMALQVDVPRFRTASRHIHTGMHPSFPSGHCAQGLLIGAGMIDDVLTDDPKANVNVDAIMQYGVDFGDRRVFAGVHYPTDNIASWVNAILLSRLIYTGSNDIQSIIRNAIKTQSAVYKLIDKHYRDVPALKPAVDYMDRHI